MAGDSLAGVRNCQQTAQLERREGVRSQGTMIKMKLERQGRAGDCVKNYMLYIKEACDFHLKTGPI